MENQKSSQSGNTGNELSGTNVNQYGIPPDEWNRLDKDSRESFERIFNLQFVEGKNRQAWIQEMTAACGSGEKTQIETALTRVVSRVILGCVRELHHV
jgi:hypothetical protein